VVLMVGVYFLLIPNRGRRRLHNFLNNLTKPTTFVKDLLQGKLTRGSQTVQRFMVNTSFSLGGFVDVASQWKMPNHGEDFGQTLAVRGVGKGPYIMLPFFGPPIPVTPPG
jgi:phospholipid-binding lipoprotein MlaA